MDTIEMEKLQRRIDIEKSIRKLGGENKEDKPWSTITGTNTRGNPKFTEGQGHLRKRKTKQKKEYRVGVCKLKHPQHQNGQFQSCTKL